MKAVLYILQSEKGRYYIGSTSNLARRLEQYSRGHTVTTRRFGSFKLVFTQSYGELSQARSAERRQTQ
ncbi:MAG: GIY-YIG nuclease family protein [Candidatus Kerfeldbacteria bacterium]|nr:GIY-YIG nuclease family protein [Candidatus Kerfeldbacteria bacterium]